LRESRPLAADLLDMHCVLLACILAVPQPPPDLLPRVVRHFDFEDAEVAPIQMPAGFYRFAAGDDEGTAASGFPPFGRIALTSDAASGGRWSLGFELAGGSMAARVPTSTIPVMPLNSYLIAVRVRTGDLVHARARLAAWLHDTGGDVIVASRVESRPIRSDGAWSTLAVRIDGRFADARDLVVELQLLQPRQFEGSRLTARQPVPEDFSGRAWFDDLMIIHLPAIDVIPDGDTSIFIAPAAPAFTLGLRDPAGRLVRGRIEVSDIDGITVLRDTLERGTRRLDLGVLPFGWYRMRVDVLDGPLSDGAHDGADDGAVLAGQRITDFVYMPAASAGPPADRSRFGARVTQPDRVAADALEMLGVGGAIVVADEQRSLDPAPAIERMIERELSVVVAVASPLPDPSLPHNNLMARFGPLVGRWQLGWKGAPTDPPVGGAAGPSPLLGTALILRPRSAEEAAGSGAAPQGWSVDVPHEFAPTALAELLGPDLTSGAELVTTFALPPPEGLAPRQRVIDLLLRGLHGWRAGLPFIAIDAPWTRSEDGSLVPDPTFPAWRTLIQHLAGRRFVAELDLAPGVRAWLVEGRGGGALVIWGEQARGAVEVFLGHQAVDVVDAFGNVAPVSPHEGVHRIEVADTPVVVEGLDLPLALFRAALRIEPATVLSAHQVQDAALVVSNPWDSAINGTMHLESDGEWEVAPGTVSLSIGPGSEARIGLAITPRRSVVAGRHNLRCRFEFTSGVTYAFRAAAPLDINAPDLDLVPQWRLGPGHGPDRDLFVDIRVTNRGARPYSLDAFLYARGVGIERRPVGPLGPGETALRTVHIPRGLIALSGQRAFVGVDERGGPLRLTQVLEIPEIE
jgi:hypothetical protein